MYIIDSHAHIFPQKIAHKATESIGEFYNTEMCADASSDYLINNGKAIGVNKYLVCSSAVTPQQTQGINDFIKTECDRHPKFIGLAAMHPKLEDYEQELSRIKKLGLVGIKIHPDFQHEYIDDENATALYRAIAKMKLPVLFHMGDDRYDFSSPQRLNRLLERVPELKVIAAHFGGYQNWKDAFEYLPVCDNIVFDTSSSLAFLSNDEVFARFEKFGIEKFMFGVDFPMWSHKDELERINSLGLSEKEQKMLFHENFLHFFNMKTPADLKKQQKN